MVQQVDSPPRAPRGRGGHQDADKPTNSKSDDTTGVLTGPDRRDENDEPPLDTCATYLTEQLRRRVIPDGPLGTWRWQDVAVFACGLPTGTLLAAPLDECDPVPGAAEQRGPGRRWQPDDEEASWPRAGTSCPIADRRGLLNVFAPPWRRVSSMIYRWSRPAPPSSVDELRRGAAQAVAHPLRAGRSTAARLSDCDVRVLPPVSGHRHASIDVLVPGAEAGRLG